MLPPSNPSIPSDPPAPAHDMDWPPASRAAPPRVPASAQLVAWSVDLAVVLGCSALHVALAPIVLGPSRLAPAGTASPDYWVDLLLRGPRLPALWAALGALLAMAYSWLFAAAGGRTPGLALAGLRLQSVRGGSLTVRQALARAALALLSAALGLCGFALALIDRRGQTLHDKLCGAIVVRR